MSYLLNGNGIEIKSFKLSEKFIERYKKEKPPFGFGGLGEFVYRRTYSRRKPDGTKEEWWETVRRVVEGTYTLQKRWIEIHALGWNGHQAQYSAQEMYDRMFNMKFLPPGRGLWAMGSPIIEDKGLFAALNNCSFVSTENLKEDPTKPFVFLMDMSMLGVGVGGDTKGEGSVVIKGVSKGKNPITFTIPDTREGWVESVKLLLESYFYGLPPVEFDYSEIRGKGEPIKTFGGISSGPEPLKELHQSLASVMEGIVGEPISITVIVDIMNMIGRAVVSGGVRRTAEIVFGDYGSEEYLDLKNYSENPHRRGYGWTSNNSVFADIGMDYSHPARRTSVNGEPGYLWLENARAYGRMGDPPNHKDSRAMGANPCNEQTLESFEVCNLVETFPYRHENKEDFLRTLKFAYLYAKTVTLGKTHWAETNRVMLRNRRIGCSMSGIVQFIAKWGMEEFREWCEDGYKTIQIWDRKYSDWLAIPKSIKTTSIKPSGTVSLLTGATPGVHFPLSRYYIRRVRVSKQDPLLKPLEKAGYNIEEADEDKTAVVVEFPVDIGENVRSVSEVSMWEQLELTAFLQKYWADNQVSCTISFDPKTEGEQIVHSLNYFQYKLKGVSFLPRDNGVYKHMPYEPIPEEEYRGLVKKIKPIRFSKAKESDAVGDKFCDSDVCEFVPPKKEESNGNIST